MSYGTISSTFLLGHQYFRKPPVSMINALNENICRLWFSLALRFPWIDPEHLCLFYTNRGRTSPSYENKFIFIYWNWFSSFHRFFFFSVPLSLTLSLYLSISICNKAQMGQLDIEAHVRSINTMVFFPLQWIWIIVLYGYTVQDICVQYILFVSNWDHFVSTYWHFCQMLSRFSFICLWSASTQAHKVICTGLTFLEL